MKITKPTIPGAPHCSEALIIDACTVAAPLGAAVVALHAASEALNQYPLRACDYSTPDAYADAREEQRIRLVLLAAIGHQCRTLLTHIFTQVPGMEASLHEVGDLEYDA
jgi:K+-sensing histidine kinase KdpD